MPEIGNFAAFEFVIGQNNYSVHADVKSITYKIIDVSQKHSVHARMPIKSMHILVNLS